VLSGGLHPHYRAVVETYLGGWPATTVESLAARPDGHARTSRAIDGETSCVVVQSPSFFGRARST
jgi:glycine dehydrogenase subunit 1